MLSNKSLPLRLIRGLALVCACVAPGIGLATGQSQGAHRVPSAMVGVEDSADPLSRCGSGAAEAKRIFVQRANGGTRTMVLCNEGNDGDPAATAQALSTAIDAAAGDSKFYAHARMPELISLRLRRAHAEVNPSLAAEERIRTLTEIAGAIKALEDEMAKTAKPY